MLSPGQVEATQSLLPLHIISQITWGSIINKRDLSNFVPSSSSDVKPDFISSSYCLIEAVEGISYHIREDGEEEKQKKSYSSCKHPS